MYLSAGDPAALLADAQLAAATQAVVPMDAVVAAVRSLRSDINVPSKLSDVGMRESDVAQFVEDAQKSQGIFIGAPRPVGADDLAAIYRSAL